MASNEIPLSTVVIFFGMVTFIIYKLFLAPASANTQLSSRSSQTGFTDQQVALARQLHQMFPHIDFRTILWNLRHNNNDPQTTSELILAGRISQPSASFQVPEHLVPNSAPASPKKATNDKAKPDLITRYKLHDKISSPPPRDIEPAPVNITKIKVWSSNKEDRQALLKKRREDMILQARRKMEEKLAAQKS